MSWVESFGNFLGELSKRDESIEILSHWQTHFSVHVEYQYKNGLVLYFDFSIEELDLVEGETEEQKVKEVMKLYNFDVK